MSLEDVLFKQVCKDYRRRNDYIFYRRALRTDLVGSWDNVEADSAAAFLQVQPTAREVGKELDAEKISHLIRFPYESNAGYAQRFLLSSDGGESYRIASELIGHLMRPGYTLNLDGFADEYVQKLQYNIDNEGTDFPAFAADVALELIGIGRATYLTTTDEQGSLYTSRVKRENIRDYQPAGDALDLIIFDKCRYRREGYELYEDELAVLISPTEWIYGDKKTRAISRFENPLGAVPVADVWFADGTPLLASVCRLQYLLLNAESVLAQKIRNQAIAILNGPTGIREQLKTLSAQKVIELPPDSSRGLEWAAYPAASLDADFKYIQFLVQKVTMLGAMRMQTDAPQSGESKMWDFLSQQSLLEQIATAVENCVNKVLDDWEMYAQTPHVEKRFVLNRSYDARSLKETLELIFQAMTLQLGETVETKLKMTARDALTKLGVALSDEEKAQSDSEIESANDEARNVEFYAAEILKPQGEMRNENT